MPISPVKTTKRLVKILTVTLTISLAFTIASSYELAKLVGKYNDLHTAYNQLKQKKNISNVPKLWRYNPYSPISPENLPNPTLSQKNKNPLNIKRLSHGQTWQGQIGVDKFGHVIFSTWEHGVRAASFTLRSYARNHHIDTVAGLVSRFCDAKGKRYDNYVRYICKRIGVEKDQKIDLVEYMPQLLRVMARYESGMDLPEELFVPYDVVAFL